MSFEVRTARRDAAGRTYDAFVAGGGGAELELWPGLGGNCLRWRTRAGGELLDAPPLDEFAGRPTRGGIPVLFPFPNRIRGGRFAWDGREYQLPLNDSSGQNAIHGFSPRAVWRVVGVTADTDSATVTLAFRASLDAPASLAHWPADYDLEVAWELRATTLTARARVAARDRPLPFGLGFHPYLRVAGPNDRLQVYADERWELDAGLPTSQLLPLDEKYDLRTPRRVGDLALDDVYTALSAAPGRDGLRELGRLMRADGVEVAVRATSDFRDVVPFTPPHRRSVCVEPYTCPTDAVNLTASGAPVGWRVLAPGDEWTGEVQWECQ